MEGGCEDSTIRTMISTTNDISISDGVYEQRFLTHSVGNMQITSKLESMASSLFIAPIGIVLITARDVLYNLVGRKNSYEGDNN